MVVGLGSYGLLTVIAAVLVVPLAALALRDSRLAVMGAAQAEA